MIASIKSMVNTSVLGCLNFETKGAKEESLAMMYLALIGVKLDQLRSRCGWYC